MKIFFLFLFSFTSTLIYAQDDNSSLFKGVIRDASGRLLSTRTDADVKGSQYLFNEYLPAKLVINDRVYPNIKVKIDLEKNSVYIERDGYEMMPAEPVSAIEFSDKKKVILKNGFPNIDKNTTKTYYQVIDSGKAVLLKHITINKSETRAYNSAATILSYEQIKNYYLFVNNKIIQVKKADVLLDALKDKKKEMDTFMSANKIKLNKEEDLRFLIGYYNTL